ncbi:MAG TPA: hypothetical protein VFL83_21325 [Anaeromyxobacter sp.]|nr:hypothetical protein [Anaeromyxobacter sp.]
MCRALAAAALALALAACSVDVEGAPCRVPGEATDCPSGQACTPALICSKHVGGCVAAGTFCTPGGRRCAGALREACVGGDDCGVWQVVEDCGASGLACGDPGGAPACVCPAPAAEIVVDVAAPRGDVVPTGAAQPAACRFGTIGAALAYARDTWPAVHPGTPAVVRAVGAATAEAPLVFAGETFPIRIPAGVTLATASSPPAPLAWVVRADPQTASNVLELESGAVVEGFTLRSASATGDGIVVACGTGSAPAVANDVRVEGGGFLLHGVTVTGGCGLTASELVVSGATKSGVRVNAASPTVGVTITGGAIQGCGESGAEVLGGLLVLQGKTTGSGDVHLEIESNARHGVRAAPAPLSPRAIDLRLHLADVHDNGEVGVLVKDLGPSSTVRISSSRLRKNTGTNVHSVYGNGRIAGGLLLWGNMPTRFELHGNTLCANSVDQVGVYSDDRWPLSAPDCTASNVFVKPGSGYFVYSTTELPNNEVPAENNRWSPNPPPPSLVMSADFTPSCGLATVPSFCP